MGNGRLKALILFASVFAPVNNRMESTFSKTVGARPISSMSMDHGGRPLHFQSLPASCSIPHPG